MKKFVIFALVLIVTVSLGVTTFYFFKETEELVVSTEAYVYANKGDTVEIDAVLKNGKINNEIVVTSLNENVLRYNPTLSTKYPTFDAENGGMAIVEIKTKNSRIQPVYIEVSIGDGGESTPYFIDTEEDLSLIGTNFEKNAHYILKQDISLSTEFKPILNGDEKGFSGVFDGNGYTIKNLTLTTTEGVTNAGLFSKIASTGVIKNLNLTDVNIDGEFENAGAFAGVNEGTITRCEAVSGRVSSTSLSTAETPINVGGISGATIYSKDKVGRIDRCASRVTVSGASNVGGLTGLNDGAIIINSYVYQDGSNEVKATSENSNIGGIVGLNQNKDDTQISTIKNCYAVANITVKEGLNEENIKKASLIGYNSEITNTKPNNIMGLYADNTLFVTANHQYSPSLSADAKIKNFRGLSNSFPKIADRIDISKLESFVAKQDEETILWDFVNVWQIDENVNDGYPSLIKNGASVPDEISLVYDPTRITSEEDFIAFVSAVNSGNAYDYYSLEADLTFTSITPIGTDEHPFKGIFSGNNHTITGVIVSGSYKYAGLFGKVAEGAKISNLTLKNVQIDCGATYAGSVAGYSEGTITNITVSEGNVVGKYAIGGIAGLNAGEINNCKVLKENIKLSANVDDGRYAGGLVGINGKDNNSTTAIVKNSSVVESFVYDDATATDYDFRLKDIEVNYSTDFTTYKTIEILLNGNCYVAGLVGANYSKVYDCYSYKTDVKTDIHLSRAGASGAVGLSKNTSLFNQNEAEVKNIRVVGGNIEGFSADGLCKKQCGIIEYCEVQAESIKGIVTAGLTTVVSYNGRLRNCSSQSYLTTPEKDYGVVAGIVTCALIKNGGNVQINFASDGSVDGAKNTEYGEFSRIFAVNTFDNEIKNAYFDSGNWYGKYSPRMFSKNYAKNAGIGTRLIWVNNNSQVSQQKQYTFGSINKLEVKITEISNEMAKSNYEVKYNNNNYTISDLMKVVFDFDADRWIIEQNSYPQLTGLPEIIEE